MPPSPCTRTRFTSSVLSMTASWISLSVSFSGSGRTGFSKTLISNPQFDLSFPVLSAIGLVPTLPSAFNLVALSRAMRSLWNRLQILPFLLREFSSRQRAVPCPKRSAISLFNACTNGASVIFLVTPAMVSTACSARSIAPKAKSGSFRRVTRKWRPSWPRPTPNSQGTRRLYCDFRSRRFAPDHGALRRAARSSAGAGHRRSAGAQRAGRAVSAGARSGFDVQGRGQRLSSQQASTPAQVRHLIDRAARIALSRRTVTAIVLPNDLQDEAYRRSAARAWHAAIWRRLLSARRSCRMTPISIAPQTSSTAGKKVAMLVGAGALGATDEVIAVADRLSAGCAKALLGKAALPDDLPWVTGSIGLLGTEPSYKHDDGVRHVVDGRVGISLLRVPAERRQGPRRPDRYRRRHAVDPLSDGGQPCRRCRRDAARAVAAA